MADDEVRLTNKTAERLLKEWAPDKVRILKLDYWYRWDAAGYTGDASEAGLYTREDGEAHCRRCDPGQMKVVQVDPERFAIDAIMERVMSDAEDNPRWAEYVRAMDLMDLFGPTHDGEKRLGLDERIRTMVHRLGGRLNA